MGDEYTNQKQTETQKEKFRADMRFECGLPSKNKMENTKLFNNGKTAHGSALYCPECKTASSFTSYSHNPVGPVDKHVCDNCGWEQKTFGEEKYNLYDHICYIAKCDCGQETIVTTQENRRPEYRTDVGVVCHKCKNLVWFILPVG